MDLSLIVEMPGRDGKMLTCTWHDVKQVVMTSREAQLGVKQPKEFMLRCLRVMELSRDVGVVGAAGVEAVGDENV